MKFKWKVSEPPVGRYKSFQKRMWPGASYLNKKESPAAQIYCEDGYKPWKARSGEHKELTLCIADHSVMPWAWRTIKKRFKTLVEAKIAFDIFIKNHPEYMPKE